MNRPGEMVENPLGQPHRAAAVALAASPASPRKAFDYQDLEDGGIGTRTPSGGERELLKLVKLLAKEITKTKAGKIKEVQIDDAPLWDKVKRKFTHGNLAKFLGTGAQGSTLSSSDADSIVNTMALVGALILTIPFGIIGSLNTGFWDALRDTMSAAKCPPILGDERADFDTIYKNIVQTLCVLVYMAMGSLLMSVVYYTVRPSDDDEFDEWWPKGRWAVGFIFACTVSGVVCTFCLFNYLVPAQWFVAGTPEVCASTNYKNVHEYYSSVVGGMVPIIVLVVLLGFYLL